MRKKYDEIERDSSLAIANSLSELTTHINRMVAGVRSSEAAQEVARQAKIALDALDKAAQSVGDTKVVKQVATTAKTVRSEMDKLADVRMYTTPGTEHFIKTCYRAII